MFKFHSFTCSCPVFTAPLIEKTFFSPLHMLDSFVVDYWTIAEWVYIWAVYSISLIYASVFVPVPYCFDYCSFELYSEVKGNDTSSFVFCFFSRLL